MDLRRALAGLVGVSLLGIVPIGLASPAQAAESTIDARISKSRARYDERFTISGTTTCNASSAPGTVTVHRRFAGTKKWKRLGRQSAARFSFRLRAKGNADYAVVYGGSQGCTPENIGGPQKVFRRIPIGINDRLVFSGKVKPAWKRKPVVIQVKRAGRWVKWRTVRTNGRSAWSRKLYARQGTRTHFRAVVRRTQRFQKTPSRSVYTFYTNGRVGYSSTEPSSGSSSGSSSASSRGQFRG